MASVCSDRHLDRYRGCLLGTAVGDALGAPTESLRWPDIVHIYGPEGVHELEPWRGFAAGSFTDDTQMTLATARGLLAAAESVLAGDHEEAASAVYEEYLDWLRLQADPFHRRGPGNTCLTALLSGRMGTPAHPLNLSKGCGGVMRVAPVGLALPGRPDEAFALGVATAAITHGHPCGYNSAGCAAAIVARLLVGQRLDEAVEVELERPALDDETRDICRKAVELARAGAGPDRVLARSEGLNGGCVGAGRPDWAPLGEGWVGEEALAIALYCALAFAGEPGGPEAAFEAAVRAAANHSGDTDSTAAVTGAILGTALGETAIPRRWAEAVQARDEILALAGEMRERFGR
ncbi:MAG: ADP-ribosylglycohydrolase family protein [Firmicutes bacterium]|nr:ADP-ribosylglycohydrolase family protein [Bacillota bacterium]